MRCRVATITRSSGAGTRNVIPVTRFWHAPGDEAPGHCDVLAGLTQTLRVNFHRLRQAGHGKVPFVRQPVAPAARLSMRAHARGHDLRDLPLVGGGVEIEIVAQVRPVIERLHHRRRTAALLQRIADMVQVGQRVLNARLFLRQNSVRPTGQLRVAAGHLRNHLEGANDDVVRIGQARPVRRVARCSSRQHSRRPARRLPG